MDREALIERAMAMQAADHRRLDGLGFDWRECPRREYGPSREHPLNAQPGALQLVTGRNVRIQERHQHAVYGGVLSGLPPTPSHFLVRAVERAESLFPGAGKPLVLPPEVRYGSLVTGSGSASERPWALLPDVCTIALLVSNTPARDRAADASQLVVVWFEDDFGNLTPRTLDQVRAIDWGRWAMDVYL